MRREIPIAFPIMIGAIGIILGIYSSVSLAKVRAAAKWPTTMGIVMESSVQTEQKDRERRQSATFYQARVRYQYKVDGNAYSSDKVRVNLRGQSQPDEPRELVARYPVNATVPVHYNPDNPAEAVLQLAPDSQTRAVFGAGIAFLLVSIIMLGIRAFGRVRPQG
jgi:hypothetical protein